MFLTEEYHHLKIQLQDIILATNNFGPDKLIGRGGFGPVYIGELSLLEGRSKVAIKRLNREFGQGNTEFWKEVMTLSEYKHANLVSLLRFCVEGDERILVYEYASRGSLDHYQSDANLTWIQRLKICVGVARGLNYLHDPRGTKQRILHRDIKSSNILLDENWNAKVSDFGLSKVGPANQPHTYVVSNAVGTIGYCDPSYHETGLLSKESDVYSFGVVLFEVMCGRLCYEYHDGKITRILVSMWRKCFKENRLDDIIFHDLKEQIQHDSLMTFSTMANRCLKRDHKKRPAMVDVVQELEVAIEQQLGKNTKEESYEIKNKGVKLLPTISETTPSLEEPPVLMVYSGFHSWWAFKQGFTYGTRLPSIPGCDEYFSLAHKQSLTAARHLLVVGKDLEGLVIWRYELLSNKWYKGPSMITPRFQFASATCHNSAFVAGGVALNGTCLIDDKMVEKYDAQTRSWTPLPRMKRARTLCSGCYMDNKFYVIGGRGPLTCGEFFDQETNQWTVIENMLKDINHYIDHRLVQSPPLIAVVNNELYLIEVPSNELKVYLKNTNSWKALGSVPVWVAGNEGFGVGFVSFCNELVVIGASATTVSMSSYSNDIYTCSPEEPQSDHLPEWKLRDYGNIQLVNYIYNCSAMH